jgi:hypothetical protein
MPESYTRTICEWIVKPTRIRLEIRMPDDNNKLLVDVEWDKDEFWKQIKELKEYSEERGDVING